jgi:hypothetical protein
MNANYTKNKSRMNLTDTTEEILIEAWDTEGGMVGCNDITDMRNAERQTHCAAPQPAYNTGSPHARSISALMLSRAKYADCSEDDTDCSWRW